jgi:8-oxo-dGTP diphosphatase
MTKYCLGFMFNNNETDVLLIEKQKPVWQAGKFNGIGGKVENGESSAFAMRREFKEETGIDTLAWRYVVTMSGDDWQVDVFTCKSDDAFDYQQMESEKVSLIPLDELESYNLISNLYWLIPMCLDKNDDHKSYINYSISNKRETLIEA